MWEGPERNALAADHMGKHVTMEVQCKSHEGGWDTKESGAARAGTESNEDQTRKRFQETKV